MDAGTQERLFSNASLVAPRYGNFIARDVDHHKRRAAAIEANYVAETKRRFAGVAERLRRCHPDKEIICHCTHLLWRGFMGEPFAVGDVVVLKSGSPAMTVTKVVEVGVMTPGKKTYAIGCQWYENGKFQDRNFDPATLEKVEG
jgi:uncharacterized protein YodC (DUF2158 family)